MSKPTLREKIVIMQAAEDGATIEWKPNWQTEWDVVEKPDWDWFHCEYRVKREPRRVYVHCDADGSINFGRVFTSQEMADRWCRSLGSKKSVEFVEVLEDD